MKYLSLVYARYSVLTFNLFFALTGSITLAVSSIIYGDYKRYEAIIGNDFWSRAACLICTGLFVFLIATLCTCGVIKESSHIILIFIFLLVLLSSFEIGISAAIYHRMSQLNQTIGKSFNDILKNHTNEIHLWNMMQKQMNCCGILGPNDWNETILPSSCCPNLEQTIAIENNCNEENASKSGCQPILLEYFENYTTILAGVGVGIGWIQIVVIGYACCMYFVFRKNHEQFTETLL